MIKGKITEKELEELYEKWDVFQGTEWEFLRNECFEVEKSAVEQADEILDNITRLNYITVDDIKAVKDLYRQAIAEAKEVCAIQKDQSKRS